MNGAFGFPHTRADRKPLPPWAAIAASGCAARIHIALVITAFPGQAQLGFVLQKLFLTQDGEPSFTPRTFPDQGHAL